MKDEQKSKSQLLTEVRSLRQQLVSQENFLKDQRNQAEKALRESEVNLRTFMENARGFCVYSLEPSDSEEYGTELIFASPSIKDILGIDNPEDNTSWFEGLHPDDLERMAAAHHLALTVSSEFDETYRFYHKDKKEWRWGRAISSLVTVEGSTPRRFNGLVLDVTDIKCAEEALNKSYDELEIRVKERTADLSEANRSGTIKVSFGTATISNDSLPLFFQDDSIKIDSYVFCQIKDSGHGVSHENLEHIFDPFYTTRSTGRGLGLALTARIMQTHNGAITIDSIPDESTTVRVLLPSISLS